MNHNKQKGTILFSAYEKQTLIDNNPKKFYCIEKMLYEGADKGERNFCLGRIINYNKVQGVREEVTKKQVIDWNTRCRPPKSETEIIHDFNLFWNTDYKLLGCKFVEGTREYKIINHYCDRNLCSSIYGGELKNEIMGDNSVTICNRLFEPKIMKNMTGNDYLVLTVLLQYKNHFGRNNFTLGKLKGLLSNIYSSKCCLSDATLKKVLLNLEAMKYIRLIYSDKRNQFDEYLKICTLTQRDYGTGYTVIYFSTAIMVMCKKITPPEYRIYLYLVKNISQGKSVTYDEIANELDIDKSNVRKYIKGLHEAKVIEIVKTYNDKGYQVNRYNFFGDSCLLNEYSNEVKKLLD